MSKIHWRLVAIRFWKWLKNWLESRFGLVVNSRYRDNLLNAIPFWLGSFIVGMVAVIYAKLFQLAEQLTLYIYQLNSLWFLFLAPFCFVLAWWMVRKYAPFARGSGIPQITASIELANPKKYHLISPLLSLRVLLVKIASSLTMVLGGGAIGREGPTIQISGSVFKTINDWLPEWYPKISKKNMIITGAASGLAAAFNTPLGGIVFAIEELTKTHFNFFKSALFTGVIISGLTALSILGPYLYLGYPRVSEVSLWIVFPTILVSLISGYAAAFMGRMILKISKWKAGFKGRRFQIAYSILAGLCLASLGIWISHYTLGSGKEMMQEVLFSNEKELPWYIPLLRILGPVISFTNGAAGGIFAPSLSAGASIGAVLASVFDLGESGVNLMILCGMVAFLTGITRSPFTSSILVLEMTTADRMIFYLMLAGLVGNLSASIGSRHSFYEVLKEQYLKEVGTHAKSS